MTLVALANALLGDVMVKRFHADPRVQATELLLQERVPRHTPTIQPRPLDEMRVVAPPPAMPVRRYRSPHTVYPHAQFLSNGNYVAIVTNAGGGSSFCRGLAVTKSRRDTTRDPGSQFVYLRDVRTGAVWSATFHPTAAEPDDYVAEFRAERATFRRHNDEMATQLDISVSTEDDVEVRRVTVVNQSTRIREIDVTSYAEIVLAAPADDLAHPAFGKLFLETEYLPDSAALLCHRRPRDSARSGGLGGPRPEPRRPARRGPSNGRPTARASSAAAATPRIPSALDGHTLSGTTGIVLDPIFSLRQRVRLVPGASVRLSFATGIASDRKTAEALAQKYRDPERGLAHVRAGLHACPERSASSGHRERRGPQLRTARVARPLRRRLAAREPATRSRRTSSGRRACGRTGFPAICRSCWCAWSATTMCRSCARSCRRRSTGASRVCASMSSS